MKVGINFLKIPSTLNENVDRGKKTLTYSIIPKKREVEGKEEKNLSSF
jgi:hypothetical protein